MNKSHELKNTIAKIGVALFDFFAGKKTYPLHKSAPRILIISTTALGDTLWATPILKAIKQQHPKSFVGVLTSPMGKQVLAGNKHIDRLWVLRPLGILAYPIWRQCLKQRFEAVLIFHASQRVAFLLARCIRASIIAGMAGKMKDLDWIANIHYPFNKDHLHAVQCRFQLAKSIGIEPIKSPCELPISKQDQNRAAEYLKSLQLPQDTLLVGLHPGASKLDKQWPEEKFIALGQWLCQNPKVHIIVTGGPGEEYLTSKIAKALPRATALQGQLSIHALTALLGKMSVFIANDTGPIHLAALNITPIVGIYGVSEHIEHSYPYRNHHVTLIETPLSNATAKDPRGVKCISLMDVKKAVSLYIKGLPE